MLQKHDVNWVKYKPKFQKSGSNKTLNENNERYNGRVAFIRIVIHNHFVLPISLFIDLTFRLPNREASSEQFSEVLAFAVTKR